MATANLHLLGLAMLAVSLGCTGPRPQDQSNPAQRHPVVHQQGQATPARAAQPTERSASTSNSQPKPAPTHQAKEPDDAPKPIKSRVAARLLFQGEAAAHLARCPGKREAQISCLIGAAFAKDRRAKDLALGLYRQTGSVAGVEPKRTMNGGWRGFIELVPERPVGVHRKHLGYVVAAAQDFEKFFNAIKKGSSKPIRFHFTNIAYKFLRSVRRTTPSAYARNWSVAYNVSGSLHRSKNAVRETLFHEIFHLNDDKHGRWSERRLSKLVESIVNGCRRGSQLSTPCLRPYAPGTTMVRGGTYYAFQPGNGVWEYAAELATRYFNEHWTVLAGRRLRKPPFKCGPKQNKQAWQLFAKEFFGGIDRVPHCQ